MMWGLGECEWEWVFSVTFVVARLLLGHVKYTALLPEKGTVVVAWQNRRSTSESRQG